jgi:hypothetical protein
VFRIPDMPSNPAFETNARLNDVILLMQEMRPLATESANLIRSMNDTSIRMLADFGDNARRTGIYPARQSRNQNDRLVLLVQTVLMSTIHNALTKEVAHAFVGRHQRDVIGVLHGWDRLRLQGTLRSLYYQPVMEEYLRQAGVLWKDFKTFATTLTARVR